MRPGVLHCLALGRMKSATGGSHPFCGNLREGGGVMGGNRPRGQRKNRPSRRSSGLRGREPARGRRIGRVLGETVRSRLVAWYGEAHRQLPWRADRDPYRILVSEMMLVQTTVAAVVPYFERFLRAVPDRRGPGRGRRGRGAQGLGGPGLLPPGPAAPRGGPGGRRRPRRASSPTTPRRSGPCRASAGTSPGRSSRSPSTAPRRSSRRTPSASWRAGWPGART